MSEPKPIKGWTFELDDELEQYEEFKGITSLAGTDKDGKPITVIVGVIEKWETASRPSSKRYCNVKFKQVE